MSVYSTELDTKIWDKAPIFRSFLPSTFTVMGALLSCCIPLYETQAQEEEPAKTPATVLMDIVAQRAKALAEKEFSVAEEKIPKALENLDYQQYRAIRFNPAQALWKDEALFEVQFFHPGFLFSAPVGVRQVNADGLNTRLAFNPDDFIYEGPAEGVAQHTRSDLGYAGFRIHYPLNTEQYKDEVVVFQGASYFRIVGPGQVYGLSARGLAVNTAQPSGEEFPFFRDFWLVKPQPNDATITFFALLDSPSVAGAYRFKLTPGAPTKLDVETVLYPRKDIEKLGIAPLTSMFHHGENHTRYVDDFRPEVHDSDGLLVSTSNNEWIWRPLTNPKSLQVVSFMDENPRGFGLLQRDRNFSHYLDTEARYSDRPSLWIQPEGDWGKGRVELVEIPTNTETNDNIVSYWVPEQKIIRGREYRFRYSLHTFGSRLAQHEKAQVARTRIGWGALPGEDNPPPKSVRQFVVDFEGGPLANLSADLDIQADLNINNGKARDITVTRLPSDHQWRVAFKLIPDNDQAVDMRLFLTLREQRLSEVWNYVWSSSAID